MNVTNNSKRKTHTIFFDFFRFEIIDCFVQLRTRGARRGICSWGTYVCHSIADNPIPKTSDEDKKQEQIKIKRRKKLKDEKTNELKPIYLILFSGAIASARIHRRAILHPMRRDK